MLEKQGFVQNDENPDNPKKVRYIKASRVARLTGFEPAAFRVGV